jgi:hypothetical protein
LKHRWLKNKDDFNPGVEAFSTLATGSSFDAGAAKRRLKVELGGALPRLKVARGCYHITTPANSSRENQNTAAYPPSCAIHFQAFICS